MGVKVDREKPQPAVMAPPEDDEEGPVVWYHEGPPELTIARYWIADYSISKYGDVPLYHFLDHSYNKYYNLIGPKQVL